MLRSIFIIFLWRNAFSSLIRTSALRFRKSTLTEQSPNRKLFVFPLFGTLHKFRHSNQIPLELQFSFKINFSCSYLEHLALVCVMRTDNYNRDDEVWLPHTSVRITPDSHFDTHLAHLARERNTNSNRDSSTQNRIHNSQFTMGNWKSGVRPIIGKYPRTTRAIL